DALADAVGPAAEDDDLLAVGDLRLVGGGAGEGRLVGGVHVGGGGGELGGAGVDALEDRVDAEGFAKLADLFGVGPGERGEAGIGEAVRLQHAQIGRVLRQAVLAHALFERDDGGDLLQEPGVDLAHGVHLLDGDAEAQRLGNHAQPVGRGGAERGADGVLVLGRVAPRLVAGDVDFVEAGEARLKAAQGLLQRFGEGAADGHDLAHGLHGGGEHRLGARELLEGEARDLGDDVVDGGLEGGGRGAAGDVVFELVQRVAYRELGGDLGNGEAGGLGGERGGAGDARVHLDDDHAPVGRVDGELDVGAAGLDADLAQHRDRGVAHALVFLVGQRQRGGDGDGIARMHAHRVHVLDGADDDAVVRLVADDLHLVFLPAEDGLLDQHFRGGGGVEAALDDLEEFGAVVGDAAARAAEREGG